MDKIHLLALKGPTFDLSDISFADLLPGKAVQVAQNKKKTIFNADITAQFDRVFLKNNETLTDFRTTANCRKGSLVSADLNGLIESDKHLSLTIVPSGDLSKLTLRADDAGRLINGLDISNNIGKGILTFSAELQRPLPEIGTANGYLAIENYSVLRGPVLMNILSLASFVGILEQLKTGGIDFNQLKADFSYDGTLLEIKNGKMEGLTLGMTTSGIYDTSHDILSMEGIVVPFNMLNKLISLIPIIGKWITGDGIIATRYTVSGSADKPEVKIKPLSTLSIGFLKGLFDEFHFHPVSEEADARQGNEDFFDRDDLNSIK